MSPQPIICDDDGVELAAYVISYQDGSRTPSAHCEQHMAAWCVAYLMSTVPPEGLAQLAKVLAPAPEEPPADEAPQEPPRRRRGRRGDQQPEDPPPSFSVVPAGDSADG